MPTKDPYNIPINIQTNFDSIGKSVDMLSKRIDDASKSTLKIKSTFDNLAGTVNNLKSVVVSLGSTMVQALAFEGITSSVEKYNKTLYDVARQSRVLGQSFGEMQKSIEDVSSATHMSMQASASFVKTMQQQVVGLKMTGAEISNLAKALDSEFGSSLEDINDAMGDLITLQQKDITVLQRLKKGFSSDELKDYTLQLEGVYGASEKQIDTFLRTEEALRKNGTQVTAEQQRLRDLQDSMNSLKKAGEDLLVKWGKPLAQTISTAAEMLKGFVDELAGLAQKPWFPLVAKVLIGGGAIAAATSVAGAAIGGIRNVAGPALAMTKGLLGGKGASGALSEGLGSMLGGKPIDVNVVSIAGKSPGSGDSGSLLGKGGAAGGRGLFGSKFGAGLNSSPAANAMAGVSLAASAYGAYDVLSDDKAYEKNIQGRRDQGIGGVAGSAITNVLNPAQGGRDIATAGKLLTDYLSDWMTKGTRFDQRSEKSSLGEASIRAGAGTASGKSQAEWVAHLKDLQQKNGGGPVVAGANANETNAAIQKQLEMQTKAVAEKQADVTSESRKSANEYKVLLNQVEKTNEFVAKITESTQAQIQYLTMYKNDVAGALALNQQNVEAIKAQVTSAQALVDFIDRMKKGKMDQKQVEQAIADLTKDELAKQGITDEAAITQEIRNRLALVQNEEKAKLNLAAASNNLNKTELAGAHVLDQRVSTSEAELGLIEAQYNMTKSMYLGLGPTLNLQMQMVEQLDKQKELYADQYKKQIDIYNQSKGKNIAAYQEALMYQQKLVSATQKQLDITKHLREGYLDAMTAFTNVEGSFGKIILGRENGMAEIMRQFKAPGGPKLGAVGAGGDTPFAKFNQGGGFEFSGQKDWDNRAKKYLGSDADLLNMRPTPSVAGAIKDMGPAAEDALRGQSIIPGMNSRTPTMNALGVTTSGDASKDPVDVLSKGVELGIKASGLVASTDNVKKSVDKTEVDKKQDKGRDDAKGLADRKKQQDQAKKDEDYFKKMVDKDQKQLDLWVNYLKNNSADKMMRERGAPGVGIGRHGHAGGIGMSAKAPPPGGAGGTDIASTMAYSQGRTNLLQGGKAYLGGKTFEGAGAVDALNEQYKSMGGKPYGGPPGTGASSTGGNYVPPANIDQARKEALEAGQAKRRAEDARLAPERAKQKADATRKKAIQIDEENAGGLIAAFAAGGKLPGYGKKDTVPAMLTPGEFVVNAESTRKFLPSLQKMNAARYAAGGGVSIPQGAPAGAFSADFTASKHAEDIKKAVEKVARNTDPAYDKQPPPSQQQPVVQAAVQAAMQAAPQMRGGADAGRFNKFGGPLGLDMGSKPWNPMKTFKDASVGGQQGPMKQLLQGDITPMVTAINRSNIARGLPAYLGGQQIKPGEGADGKAKAQQELTDKLAQMGRDQTGHLANIDGNTKQSNQQGGVQNQLLAQLAKTQQQYFGNMSGAELENPNEKAVVTPVTHNAGGLAFATGGMVPGAAYGGYATGGVVPSPSLGGGGGGTPKFNFNIRGDSAKAILNETHRQLSGALTDLMTPVGTTGRYYDIPNSG